MKTSIRILLTLLVLGTIACKKKTVEADPYAFLHGTWQYANGAECIYEPATKSAKGTKVPDNNASFKFVVGEAYWKNVVSTGTDKWEYEQIVRFSDGTTVEYRKSTMAKKDENTLTINTPGLSDSSLKRIK